MSTVKRISHRGAAGHAQDNTLEAVREGLERDADMIEIDVRILQEDAEDIWEENKDPRLMMTHDWYLWGEENLRGLLQNKTREQLQQVTLENGESLSEAWDALTVIEEEPGPLADVMIDMKGHLYKKETAEGVGRFTVKAVDQGPWNLQNFIAAARHRCKLEHLQEQYPDLPTGYSAYPWLPKDVQHNNASWLPKRVQWDHVDQARELDADAVQYPHKFWTGPFTTRITQKEVDKAHQYGLDVYVWGASTEEEIEYLKNLDVDGIISDYPERI